MEKARKAEKTENGIRQVIQQLRCSPIHLAASSTRLYVHAMAALWCSAGPRLTQCIPQSSPTSQIHEQQTQVGHTENQLLKILRCHYIFKSKFFLNLFFHNISLTVCAFEIYCILQLAYTAILL